MLTHASPPSFAVLLLLLHQVLADSVCWDRLAPPEVLALVDWALGLPPGLPLAAPLKDAALRCISRQVRWRGWDDREEGRCNLHSLLQLPFFHLLCRLLYRGRHPSVHQ